MVHHHSGKEQREDLTGEHRFCDAGQLIIFILFMAVWLSDSFLLKWTTFLNAHVHPVVQLIAGGILVIASGYLAWAGLTTVFGGGNKTQGVIRKGVFGVMRHPVYLSEMLLYLGLLFFSPSIAAALVWVIAIGFLHYMSRYEEKLLLARFGEEYRRYMREVPMYIPRLVKRR